MERGPGGFVKGSLAELQNVQNEYEMEKKKMQKELQVMSLTALVCPFRIGLHGSALVCSGQHLSAWVHSG